MAALTGLDRESGLKTVQAVRERYAHNKLAEANEAKTRLLAIDQVLEAVGWTRDDFNPEEGTHKTGFTDYLLRVDGVPRLIVEAKRYDHTFRSPASTLRKSDYTVSYIRRSFGPALTDVLEQAERYARENQVPFAALTNGQEWLLLQLIPSPGTALNDLRCVYFGNAFSDNFVFELFWDLLSRSAISDGALEDYFSQLNQHEAEYSKTPKAELGDLCWAPPSPTPSLLRDFYDLFFDEITDPGRRLMLEHCFVADSRMDQYQGELRRALKDSAPAYIPDAQEIAPSDRDAIAPRHLGDQKGRVVVVTGSVGCGKTTFVTKVLVDARREKAGSSFFLYVDLIDEVGEHTTDFVTRNWSAVRSEWSRHCPKATEYGTLVKVFATQLKELRGGANARVFQEDENAYRKAEAALLDKLSRNPEAFVQASWRYFHQQGAGISIVFDNADRASEDYQKHVYGFAHRLARETGATAILTMREATFFRGQGKFLDVRSSDTVLHLSAPDLVRLLSKRIRYIENELEKDHRAKTWKRTYAWEAFRDEMRSYAETLKHTFLGGGGQDLLQLLAAVAWHDVRHFLKLVRRLHTTVSPSKAAWSLGVVLPALMTPGSNPEDMVSVIPNIYEPPFPNYDCYFVKLRVLSLLHNALPPAERRRGKPLPFVLRVTRMYGYQERWTRRALQELVRGRALECIEAPAETEYTRTYELNDNHSFRVSPLAIVLLDELANNGAYLALCGNTLPFHKREAAERYIQVLKDLQVEHGLDNAAAAQLISGSAAEIVGKYLAEQMAVETPNTDVGRYLPEAQAIDERLASLLQHWRDGTLRSPTAPPEAAQLLLFGGREPAAPPLVPAPPEVSRPSQRLVELAASTEIEGSTLAPLILVAMVILDRDRRLPTTGAEITRIINDYIVDDHQRKAPTNISRALRKPVLRRQPWLTVTTEHGASHPRYALAGGWKDHWMKIFGTPWSTTLFGSEPPPP